MKTYRFEVRLVTEVEAFSPDDAKEALLDIFGVGEDGGGINIVEVTIKETK